MKDIAALSNQVRKMAYDSRFGSYKFEIRKFAWSEQRHQGTQKPYGISAAFLSAFFAIFAFSAVK